MTTNQRPAATPITGYHVSILDDAGEQQPLGVYRARSADGAIRQYLREASRAGWGDTARPSLDRLSAKAVTA